MCADCHEFLKGASLLLGRTIRVQAPRLYTYYRVAALTMAALTMAALALVALTMAALTMADPRVQEPRLLHTFAGGECSCKDEWRWEERSAVRQV